MESISYVAINGLSIFFFFKFNIVLSTHFGGWIGVVGVESCYGLEDPMFDS